MSYSIKLIDFKKSFAVRAEQLKQLDTTVVQPTSHALALTNAFREDVEAQHLPLEVSLANAPGQEDGNFLVPKVVG